MKRALLLALPALVLAGPAAAFKRSVTEQGGDVCLYWPDRRISWRAASPLGAAAGESATLAALRASFAAWNDVDCSDLLVVEGGRFGREVGYDRSGGNANVVLFRTQGTCERYQGEPCWDEGTCPALHDCWDYPTDLLAVTTTTFDVCGQLLDADIEFNGGEFTFTAADGPPCQGGDTTGCVAFDVQNTATHEIGHLLGLDHPGPSADPAIKETTMHASAASGETKKRSLEPDDVEGICTVYPEGRPALACVPASECSRSRPRRDDTCAAAGGDASAAALALVGVALAWRRRRR